MYSSSEKEKFVYRVNNESKVTGVRIYIEKARCSLVYSVNVNR